MYCSVLVEDYFLRCSESITVECKNWIKHHQRGFVSITTSDHLLPNKFAKWKNINGKFFNVRRILFGQYKLQQFNILKAGTQFPNGHAIQTKKSLSNSLNNNYEDVRLNEKRSINFDNFVDLQTTGVGRYFETHVCNLRFNNIFCSFIYLYLEAFSWPRMLFAFT